MHGQKHVPESGPMPGRGGQAAGVWPLRSGKQSFGQRIAPAGSLRLRAFTRKAKRGALSQYAGAAGVVPPLSP